MEGSGESKSLGDPVQWTGFLGLQVGAEPGARVGVRLVGGIVRLYSGVGKPPKPVPFRALPLAPNSPPALMPDLDLHLESPSLEGGVLSRWDLRMVVGDPVRFLRSFAGGPRGFWGRGDRWVAWGGALARIGVSGHDQSESRFAQVRRRSQQLLAGWGDGEAGALARPRFFGGFSFLDEPGGNGHWSGFPAAAFVLPRIVLSSGPGGTWLTSWAPESDPDGGEGIRELAESLLRTNGAPPRTDLDPVPGPVPEVERLQVTDPGALRRWRTAVRSVLSAAGEGAVEKAVLSRILDAHFPSPLDPLRVLSALRRENPRAHVFFMELQGERAFMGAAPEVLAELRGRHFQATAVAGSAGRGADRDHDRLLARHLLESAKDRVEHSLTEEEMIEVLEPRLSEMKVDSAPRILRLARIQHLESVIQGRAIEGEDVLSLVEALHPTPAVCGRPRNEALRLIREVEPFDRGWYAGPVGWFDGAGDGDFVPALRSAVGSGRSWRLFAGAGIVPGSDPEAEWDETTLKFEPALAALGAGVDEG
jgi:menaquinone-specific isochorismate synthase